jgi:hypothetical protein
MKQYVQTRSNIPPGATKVLNYTLKPRSIFAFQITVNEALSSPLHIGPNPSLTALSLSLYLSLSLTVSLSLTESL